MLTTKAKSAELFRTVRKLT